MHILKKVFVILFSIGIVYSVLPSHDVQAQETTLVPERVDFYPEEDMGAPKILPKNLLYPLKEWFRELRLFFLFSDQKKALFLNKLASERLIELKILVEQEGVSEELFHTILEKYDRNHSQMYDFLENLPPQKNNQTILQDILKQEFFRQRIFEELSDISSLEDLVSFRDESLRRFSRFLFKNPSLGEQQLKSYFDRRPRFGREILQDVVVLERLKKFFDEEKREKLEELKQYVVSRILRNIRELQSHPQEKILRAIREGDILSIWTEIIQERRRIREEILHRGN